MVDIFPKFMDLASWVRTIGSVGGELWNDVSHFYNFYKIKTWSIVLNFSIVVIGVGFHLESHVYCRDIFLILLSLLKVIVCHCFSSFCIVDASLHVDSDLPLSHLHLLASQIWCEINVVLCLGSRGPLTIWTVRWNEEKSCFSSIYNFW